MERRQRRYMSGNLETEIPSNLLFVDTESFSDDSIPNRHVLTLRLWCAEHVRLENGKIKSITPYKSHRVDDFWCMVDDLVQPKKPLWIVAHNIAHDMRQLDYWSMIDANYFIYRPSSNVQKLPKGKRSSILAIEHRPWFCRLEHWDGSTVWLVDSLNYFNCPLVELGEELGLRKLDIDPLTCDYATLIQYCERDVEIVRTAYLGLLAEWHKEGMGNWRTSAPGLAMQNFKHWHVDDRQVSIGDRHRYRIDNDPDSECIGLEREAYIGGRIEAFYYGKWNNTVYHLDIRGLYPAIMRHMCWPVKRLEELNNPPINKIGELMPARSVIAEVLVNSWEDTYPLRYGFRQIHASGNFWTVLAGEELRRCINHGHCQKLGKVITYKTAPIFEEWVDYWYRRRQEAEVCGNVCGAQLAKLILNSLHGKFGQKGLQWHDADLPHPKGRDKQPIRWGTYLDYDADTHTYKHCRVVAGQTQEKKDGKLPDHAFPAISACISAAGREHMRNLMSVCREHTILYMAVDSLIVTETGYMDLKGMGAIRDDELGYLTLKGKHSECEIVTQGCYRLDDKWIASGLWGRAEMDERGEWVAQQWQQSTPLTHGIDPQCVIDDRIVNEPLSWPKGEMIMDGWTKPFEFIPTPEVLQLTPAQQRKWYYQHKHNADLFHD